MKIEFITRVTRTVKKGYALALPRPLKPTWESLYKNKALLRVVVEVIDQNAEMRHVFIDILKKYGCCSSGVVQRELKKLTSAYYYAQYLKDFITVYKIMKKYNIYCIKEHEAVKELNLPIRFAVSEGNRIVYIDVRQILRYLQSYLNGFKGERFYLTNDVIRAVFGVKHANNVALIKEIVARVSKGEVEVSGVYGNKSAFFELSEKLKYLLGS